jgi:hypothetical protein
MQDNIITREAVANAYAKANALYVARKGARANLNKSGVNPDIAKGARVWSKMSDATFSAVVALCAGLDILGSIANATNTKKALRLPMLLGAIQRALAGDDQGFRDYLQGSAKTGYLEVCALVNGAKNRDSLIFAATGTTREGGESTLRDVSLARKLRVLAGGAVKPSTEQTQNSVAFSAGGLAQTLGIAKKDTRKSHPVIDENSPVLRAMLAGINKLSESALFALTEEKKGDAISAGEMREANAISTSMNANASPATPEVPATPEAQPEAQVPAVKGKKNKGFKKGGKK